MEKHDKKYMASCKVPVITVEFITKLEYAGIFMKSPISKLIYTRQSREHNVAFA